jgi:hypothetical protein
VASWYITCKVWKACQTFVTNNYNTGSSKLQHSLGPDIWKWWYIQIKLFLCLSITSGRLIKAKQVTNNPQIPNVIRRWI